MTSAPRPSPFDFRSRFLAGEHLIGTFVKTPTSHATEILGDLGFDFVVIDEEHAPFDRASIDVCLLGAKAAGTAGIVRVAAPTASNILSVLGGFGIAVLFGFAMSWVNAVLGLRSDDPESAQAFAFLFIFPLAFVSSVFSPTQQMPSVIRFIADWNPVSAIAGATRNLFGNPNPQTLAKAWPCQHPVEAALFWSLLILAVCIPLAARGFKQRTAD